VLRRERERERERERDLAFHSLTKKSIKELNWSKNFTVCEKVKVRL